MRRAIAACLVFTSACATLTQSSPLKEKVGASDMSFGELRPRVRSLAGRFSGQLEELADHIASASPSPDRQQEMIRFKFNVLPQMQAALFQPDPVAALLDAWALVAQLEDVLPHVDLQPEERAEATRTFARLEADLESLWKEVTNEDTSATKASVHEWAQAHPLERSLASRVSTVDLVARVTAASKVSLTGAAAELLTTTQDLVAYGELQASFMPKQARWQAEYLVRNLARDPTLLTATPPPGSPAGTLGALAVLLEDAPKLVAHERRMLLAALHAERLETQSFVTGERQAMTRDLQRERAIVLDALRAERLAAVADLERVGTTLVDRAFDRTLALVDRILLRVLLLAALLVVAGLAIALLISNSRRRHPPPTSQQTVTPPRVPVHP